MKYSFSVTLATFQVVNNHTWLVASTWGSTDIRHMDRDRK